MSKIKTTRLQARTDNGTLTIGTPTGGTRFEGDVVIPNYVTKEEVANIIAGDIDLGLYQRKDEKDTPRGYAGLGIDGRVQPDHLNTDDIDEQLSNNTANIFNNTAKIEALESDTAFRIHYNLGNMDGSDPTTTFMGINAATWGSVTQVKLNSTDADGNTHDFSIIKAGDTMWFSDPQDNDTIGSFRVDSVTVGQMLTDFNVTSISSRGGPEINDRIESKVFASQNVAEKADLSYVDIQDNWIKDNYLPLSAGQGSKMTGDIYMQDQHIMGLNGNRTHANDAVSYSGADRDYLRRDGVDSGMTAQLDMQDHRISNLYDPEEDQDAATRSYVDSAVSGAISPGKRYQFTSAGKTSGTYAIGDMFFTTENNVAWTNAFADTRYVCFAYRDSDNGFWHFARASGNVQAPACNIYIMYDGHTMGAFIYDGSTIGASSGTATGNLVVPVTGWTSTTEQSSVTANSHYSIKCEWF